MNSSERGNVKRVPGEGERAARRGYVHQDRSSARLIYRHILDRSLKWIGLADRTAGVADDLVLGLGHAVVAHQFKRSEQPKSFRLTSLLLGANNYAADLAASFFVLRGLHPGTPVQIRYFTNDYPSTNDRLVKDDPRSTTANFLRDWSLHRRRTLAEWRVTDWAPVIEELAKWSGASEDDFEAFWMGFDLITGDAAALVFTDIEDPERGAQVEALARFLSTMVADHPTRDHWSRKELLDAIGWADRFALRHVHDFPVGAYVQRNEISEASLSAAVKSHQSGYVSLVGPPGMGKSTLLQREVREHPRQHVVRYLAFVPGTAQGQNRGEADSFYNDVNAQLTATGLRADRVVDESLLARQRQFERLLGLAGDRYREYGSRVVIVVDGLDHVPREERPARSLLTALPLPAAIPDGIIFVLGTQRLDFEDIPPAVREQAAANGRRIDIAPLNEPAAERIVDALGLDVSVNRKAIYDIAGGHPLVTRYLVERLLTASDEERNRLLAGDFGFDGDLESIYEAAWRGIASGSDANETKRILALIAHAEGPIAPECLAEAVSEQAVEAALCGAGHLLDISNRGWTVFHNSFRLFAQNKPVERFGRADPAFAPSAIYRVLADLATTAPALSPQRWLRFRYLFLAGDHPEARELAGRAYFVNQYTGGREAKAVAGDVADAISLLRDEGDAASLFDLMLADAEIDHRRSIMEGAASLIDAYLAVDDFDGAYSRLEDRPGEGKHWEIVGALLEAGHPARARTLFERYSPFRSRAREKSGAPKISSGDVLAWARFAILFLDEEQIKGQVEEWLGIFEPSDEKEQAERDGLLSETNMQIVRAIVMAVPSSDVGELVDRWTVGQDHLALLLIQAAIGLGEDGDFRSARERLEQAVSLPDLTRLHSSWPLSAARIALRAGASDLATRLIAHVPFEGLDAIKPLHRIESTAPACLQLLSSVAVRVAAGQPLAPLAQPEERLLRGGQHHLVAVGSAIGAIRGGKTLGSVEMDAIVGAALRFLATARVTSGDDWFISHLMPHIGDVILDGLFNLAAAAHDGADRIASQFDELLQAERTLFRWWPSFRRQLAIKTYEMGGSREDALRRLEDGLASLDLSDPREEVNEQTRYAIAFARVGSPDRAMQMLAGLRSAAFGVFVPAKKDGMYGLWSAALSLANRADPARRGERGTAALRFLDGLDRTEGRDSGWRIARNLLFEASAESPGDAWAVTRWAARKGMTSWDGIIDSALRGMLVRGTLPTNAVLITWVHLALPWYAEPHGSTTSSGQFLKDLVAHAAADELAEIELYASESIAIYATPNWRLAYLRTLEDALTSRGSDAATVRAAAVRWTNDHDVESVDPERRSYRHVISLTGIADALASERAYNDKGDSDADTGKNRPVTYGLRQAVARVFEASPWREVQPFTAAHPELLEDVDVRLAAVRSAKAAGADADAKAVAASILRENAEGWGWPSPYGRLHLHQVRHMLGEEDRFEVARHDFFDELAQSRYGLGSLLWSTDEIFPLVMEVINWPAIWDRLESQLTAMREYRLGEGPERGKSDLCEEGLIAELFCWAGTLDVLLLREQVFAGFAALLSAGHEAIAIEICEKLIERGDEAALLATKLLAANTNDARLASHFGGKLDSLAQSDDAGIAAGASYIAEMWGNVLPLDVRDLPDFYSLHIPETCPPRGEAAVDEQTQGMVIEDPMGWTADWLGLVRAIARDGHISVSHVRWRAQQLIQSWGGIKAFGHEASKARQEALGRIDLKLPYGRPHAVAVVRAFRHVLGDLWRAGQLDERDFRFLLHQLRAYPDQPGLPPVEVRPVGVRLPKVPHMLWGKDQDAWLDAVQADVAEAPPAEARVIAEWQVSLARGTRVTAIGEYWRARTALAENVGNLGDWLTEMPHVMHLGGPLPLYEPRERHPSLTAVLEPNPLHGEPGQLMILCPLAARRLRWSLQPGSAHIFIDRDGIEVARTIWWRSGLPQPVDSDDNHAFGQRVILSGEGSPLFEETFGTGPLASMAWRRVEPANGDGVPGSKFAAYP